MFLELALDDVGREGDSVGGDRLRDLSRGNRLERFEFDLLPDRELERELVRPLARRHLVPDPDRVDVRVGQVLVCDLADGSLDRGFVL